jgi:hypothetical protein
MPPLEFWETYMLSESPGWTENTYCTPSGNISYQDW